MDFLVQTRRSYMKGNRRFLKTVTLITLLAFFSMTVSSCSMFNSSWANLKFWSKDRQSAMDEKDVNRFVGKLRIRPGNPESHYLLACYHQERGKHSEAISEFEKVLFIDASYAKAYNGKGISHDRLGEYAQAEKSYRSALSLDPKLDYVWNNLGYSYVLRGEYVEAAGAFQKALALNEKEGKIRNNLAMAYAMTGDYEKAFREFEQAGGGDRSYPHLKLASVYYEKAMFQKAIDSYRSALTLNPSSDAARKGLEASEGLLQIAQAAFTHKEMESKRALLEEDQIDPMIVGVIASAQQDETSALENYQAAVKLYEKGAFQEAKKHFTLAVADNPSLASARKGLIASEALARISEASSVRKEPVDTLKEMASGVSSKGRTIGIEVSNGNGATHMARDIAKYLQAKGFKVVRLTNADSFNHAEGGIFYEKEYEDMAGQISEAIPQIKDVRQTGKLDRPNVKVKVLVGKDVVANREEFRIKKN
jgi:tetratricopeptide (TPR) repeat protein